MEFNLLFLGEHESSENERIYNIANHTSSVALITDFKNHYVLLDTGSVWAQDKLLEKLKDLNVKPEQITHLALTHGHLDHVGNIGLFKNALVHIHSCHMDSKTGLTSLYKDMHEKPLPFGIEVFPSRGHTYEHVSYFFEYEGLRYCFAGDAVRENHFTDKVPEYYSMERRLRYLDSARHIFESCDVIIPGHFGVIEGEQKTFLYKNLLKQEEEILKRLSIYDKFKYRKLLKEIHYRRKFLKN